MRDGTIAGELPAKSTEAEVMLVATGQHKSAEAVEMPTAGAES
jgi:hypothetical protein